MGSRWVTAGVLGVGAAFGALGAYSSFGAVYETMEPSLGGKAWVVPVGMDLGIAGFSGMDMWQAWRERRTWWLRGVPHVLAALTVWFNLAAPGDVAGKAAHAGLVGLWIVFTAVITHEVKLSVGLGGRARLERLDRIRTARWLIAPVSSVRDWRWMVRNNEPSHRTARGHRNEARLVRAQFRDQGGGLLWRRHLTHTQRELYRQGRLHPVEPKPEPAPASPTRAARSRPARNGDIDTAARKAIAAGHDTRRPFIEALKEQGYRIGTKKASELLERHR